MEDSPFEAYKTKTTVRPTHFFLSYDDLKEFNSTCPVKRNLTGSEVCTGSYNNAIFKQFPPFEKTICQCAALETLELDTSGEEDVTRINQQMDYRLATNKKNITYTMDTPSTSPCIFKFKIEDDLMRWNLTYSRQIRLEIKMISKNNLCSGGSGGASTQRLLDDSVANPGSVENPGSSVEGDTGEVLLISNFEPQYWLYETERKEETIVLEAGGESQTRRYFNTHKILMLAKTPGRYEITYGVWDAPDTKANPHELLYSQIITIGCGFGLMFIMGCFFEGKNLFGWIMRKLADCRGKGKASQDGGAVEPVDTEEDEIDQEADSLDGGHIAMGGRVAERSFGPPIIEDAGFQD